MEHAMELDELKLAWQVFDRRLQQQQAFNLHRHRQDTARHMRSGLRPLVIGQCVQLLFGVGVVLAAIACWTTLAGTFAIGILLHVYGVAVIIGSGVTLAHARAIDYAAPVVDIQKQLGRLRRTYVISGMVAGLPWWVLWMAPVALAAALGGNAEGSAWIASFLWTGTAVGAAGLLATWWFHRWARQPGRERLARKLDDTLAGGSLRKAQAQLDEIARFEAE